MGSQADHQVANQLCSRIDRVVGRKMVTPGEKFVDESGDPDHVISTGFGDKDVLGLQLQHLVGSGKGGSFDITCVPKLTEPFRGHPYFIRTEMSQREIDHIKPDSSILKDKEFILCPEYAFLDLFNCPFPGDKPLNSFHKPDGILPPPQPLHREKVLLFDIEGEMM